MLLSKFFFPSIALAGYTSGATTHLSREVSVLDIHITVPPPCQEKAVAMSAEMAGAIGRENAGIDLATVDVAHLTMYLAPFRIKDVHNIKRAMDSIKLSEPCEVALYRVAGSGGSNTYAFWYPVVPEGQRTTACLQRLSDTVVNATYSYSSPTKGVYPPWYAGLPPKEKEQKEKYSDQYGSGNVFLGFDPHVSLQAIRDDKQTKERVLELVASANSIGKMLCKFTVSEITMSYTGPYGTVLRDGTIHTAYPYDKPITPVVSEVYNMKWEGMD